MRGLFTCGILDVLMEQGIRFDGAAGISAGAVFGCTYKSMQPGRALRYNLAYGRDPRYMGLRSLIKTGDLYGADFCYREIPDELDIFDRETFRKNPMTFYVGATDVRTGRIVYHRCDRGDARDIEWMRASASMPLVSRVVEIDGYELLDGGIVAPIPYKYMEKLGYRRNIVILTQPKGYVKKSSKAMPLMERFLRRYPALVEAMRLRAGRYNRQTQILAEKERRGESLVLRPPAPLRIGRTERKPEELVRVYQTGRRVARERLPEIRAFLGQ